MSQPQEFDVQVLAQLFFPNESEVKVLGNVQNDEPFLNAPAYFAFGKVRELPAFERLSFGYLCNTDGSIRWLYPLRSKKPMFLRLYNASGWRGKLFRMGLKTAFSLGLDGLLRSGKLHVFYKKELPFDGLFQLCPSGNFAIFTGTVGENRKAVFVLEDAHNEVWFFKQPLTLAAQRLVENEHKVLTELSHFRFEKLALPKAKKLDKGLLVSDVKPSQERTSAELQVIHFQAIAELYDATSEVREVSSLAFWDEINSHLNAIPTLPANNDLDPARMERTLALLHLLRSSFNETQAIATAVAHGDFTPWNLYLGHDRLHAYDWELSERLPLLYDAFHFVFQSSILIKKLPFLQIKEELKQLEENDFVQKLLKAYNLDFKLYYQLYLLRNTSYYLFKYKSQQPLHQQAHWLVEAWEAALMDAC
ncbi:MAG: hypothetical protein IT258_01365 [Saprospiraceae bacterium]|nr:hypothetical protein [Saprospiraceae bacterium]